MAQISGKSGFTLLEVLAVLAIATLVMAIALPRIGLSASPAITEAAAMRLISALDADRYAARRRGVATTSEIDVRNNRITLSTRRSAFELPSGVTVSTRAAPACDPTGRRITFFADGTSCAPLILLSSATATRTIAINALTGAIALGR